ncbi:hypothetical protein [Gimesia fumaroli]|uniref:Uncharacterized protein n=1 Tax=Gimesia fumaroli TaxID=2527976 RepID=A0A518IGB7_9PLAN|nr:hypothetical protein [Gimesia fumaroli]QDV52140.1 hypothetical protein Enr17x_42000 [Gimesia fumaroli]
MFDGIVYARADAMSDQERRWFDNIKKAIFESDKAFTDGNKEDYCFEALCKGIDTAKTLRLSLRGDDCSTTNNKKRFTEFLDLDIPGFKSDITLFDHRQEKNVSYSFSSMIYAIRCMIHENENLNAAEQPDYHILLDWNFKAPEQALGIYKGDQITLNARSIWLRLREVLVKFTQGIEAMIAIENGRGCSMGPAPYNSIRPIKHDIS